MTHQDITHIGQLIPDPKNARQHTPRNVGQIVDALHEVGAARSIVIDEGGVVLAGNATIEAAAQAGIERVRVVDADGDEIIAVRRTGLNKKQKTRLALFDNRAAELAGWNTDVLEGFSAEGVLDGLFYENEVDALLGRAEGVDVAELWRGMPEFEQENLEGYLVHVHCVTKEDQVRLLKEMGQPYTQKGISASIWYPAKPEDAKDQVGRGLVFTHES